MYVVCKNNKAYIEIPSKGVVDGFVARNKCIVIALKITSECDLKK
jgi:hypothetical protein